jgi:hypothetical protein
MNGEIGDHDSLPAPVVYLSFPKEFAIVCMITNRVGEEDCQDYVIQPKISRINNITHARPYVGKFIPKELNLTRANDYEERKPLFFTLYVGMDLLDYNSTLMMHVFDSDFDPMSDDFDKSKMTPFAESLDAMNLYVIPSRTGALLEYSRRIRRSLNDTAASIIGVQSPRYHEVKYLESEIQTINRNVERSFASIKVAVQNFNVAVEQEQRPNSLITIIGTIAGYYSVLVTFLYIFVWC